VPGTVPRAPALLTGDDHELPHVVRSQDPPPRVRLGVEPLENRTVPTNTPTKLLTGLRNTVDDVVKDPVKSAIKAADPEAVLPVINTKIRFVQAGVANAIDGVTGAITWIVSGTDSQPKQTRQNLTAAFNPAAPDGAARNLAPSTLQLALAP
jgi:hypothetical protein